MLFTPGYGGLSCQYDAYGAKIHPSPAEIRNLAPMHKRDCGTPNRSHVVPDDWCRRPTQSFLRRRMRSCTGTWHACRVNTPQHKGAHNSDTGRHEQSLQLPRNERRTVHVLVHDVGEDGGPAHILRTWMQGVRPADTPPSGAASADVPRVATQTLDPSWLGGLLCPSS